ncbi:hypothetical protein AB2L27_13770 [Kineococcus sp. LSe6-4]|uniref:Uncharacterized protein n=1 Tax=Kineococcus halophytocola TaxID=3234027 RepID=A0ABV4H2M6_9ACTN
MDAQIAEILTEDPGIGVSESSGRLGAWAAARSTRDLQRILDAMSQTPGAGRSSTQIVPETRLVDRRPSWMHEAVAVAEGSSPADS